MYHLLSADDERFVADFEAGRVPPAEFNHRAHVRLAYIYLAKSDVNTAAVRMRQALHSFLQHNGVDATKYHETMTRAWILAVNHFMARNPDTLSADNFIDANPILLDSKIMLTHYSADLLFSPEARTRFVDEDLSAIPRHEA